MVTVRRITRFLRAPRPALRFAFARWRGAEARFRAIYIENIWGDGESRSGPGSLIGSPSVVQALDGLERVFEMISFSSMADLPCGDCNWIGEFLSAHPQISYIGYDIVPEVISNNRKNFRWDFEVLDATRRIPEKVDLIFCKDMFNHLTEHEVQKAIHNMIKSGSGWLLASNNFGWENTRLPQLELAHSRHLDLMAPPYSLPKPVWATGYLGLWNLRELAHKFDNQ